MIKNILMIQHNKITRSIFPGILFLLICSSSCKNDPKTILSLTSKSQMQEDRAEDVTILYSKRGKVEARLFAHEFIRNEFARPPYTDLKKGLKVEFFDDSEKVESTLTARYARYYEKQGNVLIRDSIVVVNKKGEQLNTEELVWNQNIGKFYTEKFVRISTPTQVTYGDGLEANQDFTWYQIKNLKGMVQVNKSEVPQ
ncbi:MAG: LPS export ABC transporter periplasmic protein LptC [Bacteroidetes bacterium]|nr:LPS export ABC transporter periplasmic protein LptC [Bacteroidota bacterium]